MTKCRSPAEKLLTPSLREVLSDCFLPSLDNIISSSCGFARGLCCSKLSVVHYNLSYHGIATEHDHVGFRDFMAELLEGILRREPHEPPLGFYSRLRFRVHSCAAHCENTVALMTRPPLLNIPSLKVFLSPDSCYFSFFIFKNLSASCI